MRHGNVEDHLGRQPRARQVKTDHSIPDNRHVEAKISAVSDSAVNTETRNGSGYDQIGNTVVLQIRGQIGRGKGRSGPLHENSLSLNGLTTRHWRIPCRIRV